MNVQLSSESRFGLYTKELRELFISHGMKVGSAEDILPLASCLAVPGPVNDDITSIARSIIYREHEAIPRPELLRIIVIAAAGSPVSEPSNDLQQAMQQLENYVREVTSSLRRTTFAEEPEEPESSLEEEETGAICVAASPGFDRSPEKPEASKVTTNEVLDRGSANEVRLRSTLEAPTAVRHFNEPTQVDVAVVFRPPSSPLQVQQVPNLLPAPVKKDSPSKRSAWIGGVAAMLLILLAGFVWKQKATVQPVSAIKPSPLAVVAPTEPYAEPLAPQPSPTGSLATSNQELRRPKPSAANRPMFTSTGTAAGQSAVAALRPGVPSRSLVQPGSPAPPNTSNAHLASPSIVRTPRQPRPASSAVASTGKTGSFLVSSGVMDGNLITTPSTPNYPKMANMTGVEGKVILQAVVSRNGTVVATHVLDGHRLLRGAAAQAVRSWRYRPYLVHGKPTDVATIVIVDFHLPH